MGTLLDELAAPLPACMALRCLVEADLSDEDRADLIAALGMPEVPMDRIYAALRDRKVPYDNRHIRRHRNGTCPCGRTT